MADRSASITPVDWPARGRSVHAFLGHDIGRARNLPRDPSMMRSVTRLMGSLLMAVAVAITAASNAGAQGAFKSGVDMVPLTVTVTDASGKYVRGFTERDFAVFENGVQQSLSFFASEAVPGDVARVLGVGGSMAADMPRVREAANGLVRSLRPSDRVAVVAVRTSVGMPQQSTSEHERVTAAIDALRSSGSSAVYDGLYIALKEFA